MTAPAIAELPLPGLALTHERLGHRVWRVHLEESAPVPTLIAKCLAPDAASRVELVARRWLPAAGLADGGPALLRVVPMPASEVVWHLYEDLGSWALAESGEESDRLRALVVLAARVHRSFESHPLMSEMRRRARDLSASAHRSTLERVFKELHAIRPGTTGRAALRDRLMARCAAFLDDAPARVRLLRDLGGPDTLLHGDLWPKNGVVVPTAAGPRARLIDWDATGVGSAIYDLSTLLSRLPEEVRGRVVEWYLEEHDALARVLSSRETVNLLAETCERTRLAEWLLGRIPSIEGPHTDWAWGELTAVESWIDVPALFPARSETA